MGIGGLKGGGTLRGGAGRVQTHKKTQWLRHKIIENPNDFGFSFGLELTLMIYPLPSNVFWASGEPWAPRGGHDPSHKGARQGPH